MRKNPTNKPKQVSIFMKFFSKGNMGYEQNQET